MLTKSSICVPCVLLAVILLCGCSAEKHSGAENKLPAFEKIADHLYDMTFTEDHARDKATADPAGFACSATGSTP